MTQRTVTIDMERVNSTFQNAVPEFRTKLEQKADKQLHPEVQNALTAVHEDAVAKGFLGIPGTEKIDASILTACSAWPRVRGIINFGLKIAAWYPGYKAEIALAKGWLQMADTELVPQLCGPTK